MMECSGITVEHGERRKDQPFRVCILDVDGEGNDFWTNDPESGAKVFAVAAKRMALDARRKERA
jgi:hypothetical protein